MKFFKGAQILFFGSSLLMTSLSGFASGDEGPEQSIGSNVKNSYEKLKQQIDAEQKAMLSENVDKTILPKNYSAKKAWPLIINLHGWGVSDEIHNSMFDIRSLVDRKGFILNTPRKGALQAWNLASPERVVEIIEAIQKKWSIDPDRIYVMGHSAGARMAVKVANASALPAAVLSLSGDGLNARRGDRGPKGKTSLIAIHGIKDKLISYSGAQKLVDRYRDILKCGYESREEINGRYQLLKSIWKCREDSQVVFFTLPERGHNNFYSKTVVGQVVDQLLGYRKLK